MWIVKPGDRIFVSRTAVISSKQLSKRELRALEEIMNIYTKMHGDVLPHASRKIIENHRILRNEKYHEQGMYTPISRPTIYMVFARMQPKEYPPSGGIRLGNTLERSSIILLNI